MRRMRMMRHAAAFRSVGAIITVLPASSASRMAPHVVHVHAATSVVGNGTLATALFQWTATGTAITTGDMAYDDPRPNLSAISYNGYTDQRGFNAAFLCRNSGTITITLTITDEAGFTYTTSTTLAIVADTRTVVYCDEGLTTGANDGSSEANAFRAWEAVGGAQAYMQASGATPTRLRLNRGKTYVNSTVNLITGSSAQNVWIDAYGSGAAPLISDTQTVGPANCWDIRRDSENVLVENIDFTGDASRIVNALRFRTDTILRNVAVINCNASRVSQMTNTTENPNYAQGFLQMNCYVIDHAEYGFYGEYDDAVFLGNTATNTAQQNESSIRTSGFRMSWDGTKSKFIHPTSNKDAFRVMTRDPTHGGEYIWITRSHFIGPVDITWNSDAGNPAYGKFQVLEDSLLEPVDTAVSNTWLSLGGSAGSGYEDVTIRGCIFYYVGNAGTVNAPISSGVQLPSARVVIIDNTVVMRGDAALADVMSMDADGDIFRVERNFFLSTSDGKAYFFKAGAVIQAGNNVWYTTGSIVNVNGEGNLNLANWNARSGTADDFAQTSPAIAYTDITQNRGFRPAATFTTIVGPYTAPRGARATDYFGEVRDGTAGAVNASGVLGVSLGGVGMFTGMIGGGIY